MKNNTEVLKNLGIVALLATVAFYVIGLIEYLKLKVSFIKETKETEKIEKED